MSGSLFDQALATGRSDGAKRRSDLETDAKKKLGAVLDSIETWANDPTIPMTVKRDAAKLLSVVFEQVSSCRTPAEVTELTNTLSAPVADPRFAGLVDAAQNLSPADLANLEVAAGKVANRELVSQSDGRVIRPEQRPQPPLPPGPGAQPSQSDPQQQPDPGSGASDPDQPPAKQDPAPAPPQKSDDKDPDQQSDDTQQSDGRQKGGEPGFVKKILGKS